MSKATYRARITTKKGDYRVREFLSLKNATRYAQQLVNEGGYGYIERIANGRNFVVWNGGNGSAEKCSSAEMAAA
jgi:hypothetical protein